MRRECIAAVGKAAGRILSDAELKRLEKDILTEYKNTSVSLSNHERLILAGKAAKDNMSKATARIITTEVSNARKISAHSADINTAPAGKRLQRLMDKFMHRASSVDASTEFKQISHVIEHTKGLSELTKKHKREILADPKAFERDVLSIQLGHKVDNPLAQKFVDEHMRINDKLHLEAVENNIPFDKRAHRIAQYWDTDKLHQAGRHQFIERMHDALDKDHIAYKKADGSRQSDEWFTDLLSHTYIERLEAHSEPFHSPYGGTVGSFREKERGLHLVNDPDVHLKIREEFGSDKGIADTLIADITKLSRDVVMAREWGTKPEATLKKLISDLHKADMLATNGSNETKTFFGGNRLDYDKNMLLAGVDIMLHGETPHNAVWSARHRALRSILSAAQLGGHVIAAFIEDGWIAGQMLDRQGMDRTVLKEFRNLPKASRLKLASEIGVLSEHSLAIQSRDMGGELADKMHEWAGAGALDKRRKSEYQMVVSEQVGQVLDQYATFAELQSDPHLNPDLKKFMNQFNAVDFQVMKHAEKVSSPEGDWSMRSSNTIRNVEDKAIQDLVKSRVKDTNPHYVEKLKEHEAKRQRKIDVEAKQIEEANFKGKGL